MHTFVPTNRPTIKPTALPSDWPTTSPSDAPTSEPPASTANANSAIIMWTTVAASFALLLGCIAILCKRNQTRNTDAQPSKHNEYQMVKW
jgi:hypothetical protein